MWGKWEPFLPHGPHIVELVLGVCYVPGSLDDLWRISEHERPSSLSVFADLGLGVIRGQHFPWVCTSQVHAGHMAAFAW